MGKRGAQEGWSDRQIEGCNMIEYILFSIFGLLFGSIVFVLMKEDYDN